MFIFQKFQIVYFLVVLSISKIVFGEDGVSIEMTTYSYTKLITTTITDTDFTTYITPTINSSASNSSVFMYTVKNTTYSLTGSENVTLTNCPCTFTTYSVVTQTYAATSYASDYWITVNQTNSSTSNSYSSSSTSSESILTGTFIQSTSTSSSGANTLSSSTHGFLTKLNAEFFKKESTIILVSFMFGIFLIM